MRESSLLTFESASTELFRRVIKVEEMQGQGVCRRFVLVIVVWLNVRRSEAGSVEGAFIRTECHLLRGKGAPGLPEP